MRTVVQRVREASVSIGGAVHSSIGAGLLVLAGISRTDTADDLAWMSRKIPNLRIFEDEEGKMNRSLRDIDGELLAKALGVPRSSVSVMNGASSRSKVLKVEGVTPADVREALAGSLGEPEGGA